jgi:hypothetical protein
MRFSVDTGADFYNFEFSELLEIDSMVLHSSRGRPQNTPVAFKAHADQSLERSPRRMERRSL